jgi:hypothetical protein
VCTQYPYKYWQTEQTFKVKLKIVGNSFHLIHKEEWKEHEHNTHLEGICFIQFIDQDGNSENHPNLKKKDFIFAGPKHVSNVFYDDVLANSAIRQWALPFTINLRCIGYLIVAMSRRCYNGAR